MLSPLDDRYRYSLQPLYEYFGENALILRKYQVELDYLAVIQDKPVHIDLMKEEVDVSRVKEIERDIQHDTKAVEIYIQERLRYYGQTDLIQWVHWGLTSWDIVSVATTSLLRESILKVLYPKVELICEILKRRVIYHKEDVMMGRTHGQPATPLTMGNFFSFYGTRMERQKTRLLRNCGDMTVKFGGTVGGLHLHYLFMRDHDIEYFLDNWILGKYGLIRSRETTQIDAYDSWIEVFQTLGLMGGILLDFVKNIWNYISLDLLRQKVVEREVGSSVMPHKVNPIHWENAEGNLKWAIGLLETLGSELVESRYQRDMSDSTLIRNVGVPLGHFYLALCMIEKGLDRIEFNSLRANEELENHYEVLTEAIQHVLRLHGVENAYEIVKEQSRGEVLTQQAYLSMIYRLNHLYPQICWDDMMKWSPIDYGKKIMIYNSDERKQEIQK